MDRTTPTPHAKISRRTFLGTSALGTAACVSGVYARPQSGSRPNIVIFITDHTARQALGCYGNTYATTPTHDALAAQGVRFNKAYTSYPLCIPARAAMWTSRLPHENGVTSNMSGNPIHDDLVTLGQTFSAAGYKCVHFGKTHDADSLAGFETFPLGRTKVTDEAPCWPTNWDTEVDNFVRPQATDWFRNNTEEPFLAIVDICNPHDICGWMGSHAGPGANTPLPAGYELPPLPDNFSFDIANRPDPIKHLCCTHIRLSQTQGWVEANYQHYLAAYHHYLTRADTDMGQILKAINSTSAKGNTLFVVSADHGDGQASHANVTKGVSFYDETVNIPLIFAGPGIEKKGKELPGLASTIDIYPTVCDYAGISAPKTLSGRSLMPYIKGTSESSPHPYVVSEWHHQNGDGITPGRMIRTDRYKYTKYIEDGGEELFDMEHDPGERVNLANDPAYTGPLMKHRALLAQHIADTQDPFNDLPASLYAISTRNSHPLGYTHHSGPVGWFSSPQEPQTGVFTLEAEIFFPDWFRGNAHQPFHLGLAQGAGSCRSADMAASIYFKSRDQKLFVSKGDTYIQVKGFRPSASHRYTVKWVVDLPHHTYSCWVKAEDTPWLEVAKDLPFRSQHSHIDRLDHLAIGYRFNYAELERCHISAGQTRMALTP